MATIIKNSIGSFNPGALDLATARQEFAAKAATEAALGRVDPGSAGSDLQRITINGITPVWADPTAIDLTHPKYGFAWDGVTDDTDAWAAALADLDPSRGGTLVCPPKPSYVPNGITSEVYGMVVRGAGHRYLTPGMNGSIGTVIITDAVGAWCWEHGDPVSGPSGGNEYRGARFENITFYGTADTAGGLLLHTNSNSVVRCAAVEHTTGIGFLAAAPSSGTDASWTDWHANYAVDCLTGYQLGETPNSGTDAGGCLVDCITLKTGARGIQQTGTGIAINTSNVTVIGGKAEQDAVGIDVQAGTMVNIIGYRAESVPLGVDLRRDSSFGAVASRMSVIGLVWTATAGTAAVRVGQYQLYDVVVCAGPVIDNSGTAMVYGQPLALAGAANTDLLSLAAGGETALTAQVSGGGIVNLNQENAASGAGVAINLQNLGSMYVNTTGGTPLRVLANGGVGTVRLGGVIDHDGTTVGFNGATPVGKRTLGAAATDAATTQTLANNLRQALIDLGLGQT